MRLFDIPPEWQDLDRKIDEAEGVLSPELEQEMTALTQASEEKLDAACYMLKTWETEEKALREEAARLEARARSRAKQQETLKAIMLPAIQAMGGKVKTARHTLSVAPGKPSVGLRQGVEPISLPPALVRTTYALDKAEAGALLARDPEGAAELGIIQIEGKPYMVKR